jgi:hypothetical protein
MPNDILVKLKQLNLDLNNSYENHQESLRLLIADVENYLIKNYGIVAPWEAKELSAAKNFTDSNWLKAAIQAIAMALIVSEYNDDEYWGGFRYTNRDAPKTPRKI